MGFAGEYLYPRPTPAAAAAVDAFLPRRRIWRFMRSTPPHLVLQVVLLCSFQGSVSSEPRFTSSTFFLFLFASNSLIQILKTMRVSYWDSDEILSFQ